MLAHPYSGAPGREAKACRRRTSRSERRRRCSSYEFPGNVRELREHPRARAHALLGRRDRRRGPAAAEPEPGAREPPASRTARRSARSSRRSSATRSSKRSSRRATTRRPPPSGSASRSARCAIGSRSSASSKPTVAGRRIRCQFSSHCAAIASVRTGARACNMSNATWARRARPFSSRWWRWRFHIAGRRLAQRLQSLPPDATASRLTNYCKPYRSTRK